MTARMSKPHISRLTSWLERAGSRTLIIKSEETTLGTRWHVCIRTGDGPAQWNTGNQLGPLLSRLLGNGLDE